MSNPNIKKGFVLNNQSESILTFGDALAELGKCGSCGCDGDLGFHSLMDIVDGTEKNVVIRDGSLEVYDNNEAMKTWLKESCLRREAGQPIAGFAEGHLSDSTSPYTDGSKVTIGDVTYTLTDPFVNEPYNISLEGVGSISPRLVTAIRDGGNGTTVGTGTLPHPKVTANNNNGFVVIANEGGSDGESIITTTDEPQLEWDEPTLTIHATNEYTVGVSILDGDTVTIDGITYTYESVFTDTPYYIHIFVPIPLIMVALLLEAIRLGGNGTNIGTGTLVHPTVRQHTPISFGVGSIRAITPGIAGNSIATSVTGGLLTWANPTLTGG